MTENLIQEIYKLKVELKNISIPKQKYIETIFELVKNKGFARTKEISRAMNVKMPSVTEMLKQLSALGLIVHEKRRKVFLTDYGMACAKKLESREKILVQLFKKIGCSENRAGEVACRMEHYIDNEIAELLKIFLASK